MTRYMFDDMDAAPELQRLRQIEAIFDPKTRQHLLATGPWEGRRCLEVGAGAGSIAAWMAARAGESGHVTAVDINVRFLEPLRAIANVIEGDVCGAQLGQRAFDLAHARYVLIHNPDPEALLSEVLRCLTPNGWLLLEEPDFSAAFAFTGSPALREAFHRVTLAIEATFSRRGSDHALGRQLPSLLQRAAGAEALRLELVQLENDAPLDRGGSAIANMMKLSAAQLRQKYFETGLVSEQDVALYQDFTSDPECWAVYYSTVRVLARLSG